MAAHTGGYKQARLRVAVSEEYNFQRWEPDRSLNFAVNRVITWRVNRSERRYSQ